MQKIDFSLVDQLADMTSEEVNNMAPLHILVIGKTGVGKSTLINQVFRERLAATGIGQPITKHLRQIKKTGVPVVLYDTRGLELERAVQEQVKQEIKQTLAEMQRNGQEMHCAYYCINANSARIESMEIEFIGELAEQMPVIIVLTQSMGDPAKNFHKYIENLNLPVAGVLNVMAEDYHITDEIVIESFGLQELIEHTFRILPEEIYEAFNNAQQIDIERKAKAARSWARRYITTTFGVGFTPIPFADATILVPMQISMLAHITAIFGISLERKSLLGLMTAIGGTGGATYVGRAIVSNIVKFIPGAGTLAGGLISGTTAAVVTSALAMSYIEVLTIIATQEAQGLKLTPETISQLMKERYQARLTRGGQDQAEADAQEAESQPAGEQANPKPVAPKTAMGKVWADLRHKLPFNKF